MSRVPDLVELLRLECAPCSDPQTTKHVFRVSRPGQRDAQEEEYWRREKKLGQGGFGTVYRERCSRGANTGTVRAAKDGALRAVKVVSKRPGDVNYFRELETLAYFSYPQYESYFVRSFGWFEDNTTVSIAMEFLPQGDMQQYLERPLPESEVQVLITQLVQGLSFMHEKGFAHRDLKPANMLVKRPGPAWWIKIADFGLCKREVENITELRTNAGTFGFVAPEVLGIGPYAVETNHSYTNAVDLWSTGVISLLMLMGRPYFKDFRHLALYAQDPLRFPETELIAQSTSEEGRELVRSLLSIDPQHRPNAQECLGHIWLQPQNSWSLPTKDPVSRASKKGIEDLSGSRRTSIQPAPSDLSSQSQWSEPSNAWTITSDRASRNQPLPAPSNIAPVIPTVAATRRPQMSTEPALESVETSPRADNLVARSPPTVQSPSQPCPETTIKQQASPTPIVCKWTGSLKLKSDEMRFWCSARFSPDGSTVALGGTHKEGTSLWDVSTGKMIQQIDLGISARRTAALAWSPDGSRLALAVCSYPTMSMGLFLWDISSKKILRTVQMYEATKPWACLAFSPDGSKIALSCSSWNAHKLREVCTVWDMTTGKSLASFGPPYQDTYSLAFSPSGKQVASASRLKGLDRLEGLEAKVSAVSLWDASTGKVIAAVRFAGLDRVTSVAFSADGSTLAAAVGETIKLLVVSADNKMEEVRRIKGHTDRVVKVAFWPDAKTIASFSTNQKVRLWDVATGNLLKVLEFKRSIKLNDRFRGYQVDFSPDGKRILVIEGRDASSDRFATLWDLKALREVQSEETAGPSPDTRGQRIVTAKKDNATLAPALKTSGEPPSWVNAIKRRFGAKKDEERRS